MANIERKNQKIFAKNSPKLGQFGSAINNTRIVSGDVEVLQELPAYEEGWDKAIITKKNYPTWQEMDGVQYGLSYQIAYLLQHGIPEWHNKQEYSLNSFCTRNGKIYRSKINSNIGNDPEQANSSTWENITELGANKDFTNINPPAKNIANWSSNVSNCITEIPQDIKLELKDGILTLKAGSKYYKPNGKNSSGEAIFEVITIENNLSITSKDTFDIAIIPAESRALNTFRLKDLFSGDTAPTAPEVTNRATLWYDTNENFVKLTTDAGATWTKGDFCLPICICETDTAFKNIKQTFNGFGYIGSTIFALPGVKGLIPDGRNEDGSLKNIEYIVPNDILRDFPKLSDGIRTLFLYKLKNKFIYFNNFYTQKTRPEVDITKSEAWLDTENNNIYSHDINANEWVLKNDRVKIGTFTTKGGSIVEVNIDHPIELLKRTDRNEISGFGMPSGRLVKLSVGGNGSKYIAPANGWFCSRQKGRFISLFTTSVAIEVPSTGANNYTTVYLPVKKGDTATMNYSGGSSDYFNFVYAEGEV